MHKGKGHKYDSMFKIDSIVRGMRIQTTSKFIEQNKEIAYEKIIKKKEELINKLMVEFE